MENQESKSKSEMAKEASEKAKKLASAGAKVTAEKISLAVKTVGSEIKEHITVENIKESNPVDAKVAGSPLGIAAISGFMILGFMSPYAVVAVVLVFLLTVYFYSKSKANNKDKNK